MQKKAVKLMEKTLSRVKERLKSLGYECKEQDSFALEFCIQKVEVSLRNECNLNALPEELMYVVIERACGEFLFSAKNSGQLTDMNFDAVVKSIDEGDIKISFAIGEGSSTPEQRFDRVVNYLISFGQSELLSYRRLSW